MKSSPIRHALHTAAALAALLAAGAAGAQQPGWAAAHAVKATHTECGRESFLVLKGPGAKASTSPSGPGCRSSEEIYYELDVGADFVSNGGVSETNLDASILICGNEVGVMMLGRSRDIDIAIRRLPVPPGGCRYSKRRYERVTSVGSIPFKGVVRKQMTVAESLAKAQRERNQIIAQCNADPACRAEVARMGSRQGSGTTGKDCSGNGNYTRYNGNGGCSDSNGLLDPERHSPH